MAWEMVAGSMWDPVITRVDGDPESNAMLADSAGLALLVVLETPEPGERLAVVLHDVFGMTFDEIAPIVDGSPAAARQLASRARRRIQLAGEPFTFAHPVTFDCRGPS